MQKLRAWRKRRSEIQRRLSTSSSCMIAICPAGPPKLIIPSFSQNRNACLSVGSAIAASGLATGGRCVRTAAKPIPNPKAKTGVRV
jgi:hypothetical protein